MSGQCIIFLGDHAWRIGAVCDEQWRVDRLSFPENTTPGSRAEAAKQPLVSMGYMGQPIVLALPSSWCLCATVPTDGLKRVGRRRAMGFRLEERLPIAAEEFVADYLDTGNDEALGVCAELEKLAVIIRAFEAIGIEVGHVCPAVFLAAAYAVDEHDQADAVLIASGADDENDPQAGSHCGYDLIELRKYKPARWWWLAEDQESVCDRVAAWAGSSEQTVKLVTVGCAELVLEKVRACERLEFVPSSEIDGDQAAGRYAARVIAGTVSPWIDLRCDALAAPGQYQVYRKPALALMAAVVWLMACVLAVTQWRGWQYESLSGRYALQQVDVFKTAVPNQRVPRDVKGRLFSERKRLAGLVGQASEDTGVEGVRPVSALVYLHNVLSSLPTDLRYRILDLDIQPGLVRVDGEALNHVEADRVAAGLRRSGLYEVEPPKTQSLKEHGVSFVFTAKPRADSVVLTGGQQ